MAVVEVLELGGLVGGILLLAGLDGEEQGLEAVTKDEAGTQGSACLTIHHIHYCIFTMYCTPHFKMSDNRQSNIDIHIYL